MKTLGSEHMASLHRDIRDQNPDVWEPACQQLGELAATEQPAYTALCDMLLSRSAEVRLRGLVALRTLAPVKPLEVLDFLQARVEESRTHYDPIILDAIFFVYAALPNDLGQPLVEEYLEDRSAVVRAAAAAALPFWKGWSKDTLVTLAQDPESLVKAGLLTSLRHLEESADKLSALDLLRQADDPTLTNLLSELEDIGGKPTPYVWPEPMESEEMTELLHMTAPAPVDIGRLELALDGDPERAISVLRTCFDNPDGLELLEQLSEITREPSVSTLLKTWIKMLDGPQDEEPSEWLLTILGTIEERPDSELLQPLREFLKGCAQAAECEDSEAFLTWCCTYQVTTTTLSVWNPGQVEGVSLAPEAFDWLGHLAKVGADFEDLSLFQLSKLLSELAQFRVRLQQQCPRPERDVLTMVLELWEDLLKDESDRLMGGGVNI